MATQLNHFAGAIVWKFEDGVLYFLVFAYTYRGTDQLKFPGGCGGAGTEYPNDTPQDSLRRELNHETGLRLDSMDGVTLVNEFTPQHNPEHTKYFYLVEYASCAGNLRQKPIKDGEEDLGVPEWVPARRLARWIFKSHRHAFNAAVRELVDTDPDIGFACHDLVA